MVNIGTNLNDVDLYRQVEKNTKKTVGKEEVALIEKICAMEDFDPDYFKEKLITFSSVAAGMKNTSTIDYIKAIQYCSYIGVGDSQVGAYTKTFPERVASKATDGTIRASAFMYHNGKMVQDIIEVSMVPMHLMFMSQRFAAVEKLAHLMVHSKNERIQMESADKILVHTKAPEKATFELELGSKANDQLSQLNDTMNKLAQQQVDMIEKGQQSAKDVVEAKIVEKTE